MTSTPDSERQTEYGARLREARQAAGLTLDALAKELHMTRRSLELLESGQWQALGAGVFIRGQLRTYAKRLGLDASQWLEEIQVQPSRLISREHTTGWERFFKQLGMKTVYVVMTLGIAIPAWMALNRSPLPSGGSTSADLPLAVSTSAATPVSVGSEPLSASMAPLPRATNTPQASGAAYWVFEFQGESWVDLRAPDGTIVEKGLMKPGERRSYAANQLGQIVFGNASEVRLLREGQPQDLSAYAHSNVVRFDVSSAAPAATTAAGE